MRGDIRIELDAAPVFQRTNIGLNRGAPCHREAFAPRPHLIAPEYAQLRGFASQFPIGKKVQSARLRPSRCLMIYLLQCSGDQLPPSRPIIRTILTYVARSWGLG